MKKFLALLLVGGIFVSCNSNPQETGSEIIMEKERQDNPIEYQTKAIEGAPQTAIIDSATQMKSQADSIR